MRVLCLVTVGAFLLSIAIADNGNSMRLRRRNVVRPQRRVAPVNRRDLPPKSLYPPRRVHRDARVVAPTKVESVAHPEQPHGGGDRDAKSLYQSDSMMILEPVQQPRQRSRWSDWIPDFFGDDPPEGPGLLIGPIDFPGLSPELYIRQQEPLDDDTNHVVIHVINREAVHDEEGPPETGHPHVTHQSNRVDSSPKDHYQQSDSSHISSDNVPLDFDYDNREYSAKEKNGGSWKDSLDDVIQMPNEKAQSKLSVALLEHSTSGSPNIIWSRPVDRQGNVNSRSMNLLSAESRAHSLDASGPPLKSSLPIPTLSPGGNGTAGGGGPRRRHVHPSDARAPSESIRPAAVGPRRNRAPDATRSAHRHRADGITARPPANRAARVSAVDTYAGGKGGKNRNGTELPDGALHVVQAPDLRGASTNREVRANGTKGEEIMQRIMTMTSETWKEDEDKSSNNIDSEEVDEKEEKEKEEKEEEVEEGEKREDREDDATIEAESQTIERRIDLDLSSDDKGDEAEVEMKEAVKKIMRSYALWKHKAVSTKFVKELEEKEKKRKKS